MARRRRSATPAWTRMPPHAASLVRLGRGRSTNFAQAVTPHPSSVPLPARRRSAGTAVAGKRRPASLIPCFRREWSDDRSRRWPAATATRLLRPGKHLANRDPAAPLVGQATLCQDAWCRWTGAAGSSSREGPESGFLLNRSLAAGHAFAGAGVRLPGYQGRRASVERAARLDLARFGIPQPWFSTSVSIESPHPPYDAPRRAPWWPRDP